MDQRGYALELLKAGVDFLSERSGQAVGAPPSTVWPISESLKSPITCHAVLGRGDDRKLVLFHFWKDELPVDRVRIIRSALKSAIWQMPGWAGVEVELVVVPHVEVLGRRKLKILSCSEGPSAGDEDIETFKANLSSLWEAYHEEHPIRRWR